MTCNSQPNQADAVTNLYMFPYSKAVTDSQPLELNMLQNEYLYTALESQYTPETEPLFPSNS
jgi:hypothetical protein